MGQPLVTIITPSLNQGRFIEATIRSVFEQDYDAIEHRIYDGGSTDETVAILERYRDRLQIVSGPDGGQAAAINRGLGEARGEIVAWLNSDDVYLPGAVSAAVAYLAGHPACAAVYGEAVYINAAGEIIGRYPTGPVSRLREGCYICQPAMFMRRSAVAAVGYLDPQLRFCMDYDLWLRLASRYPIAHITADLAGSRLHRTAKTVSQQLAFHREVVGMTCRRLGAAPLSWLYGYAELLIRDRLARDPSGGGRIAVRLLATALSAALAARYHRRLDRADVRLMIERLWRSESRASPPEV